MSGGRHCLKDWLLRDSAIVFLLILKNWGLKGSSFQGKINSFKRLWHSHHHCPSQRGVKISPGPGNLVPSQTGWQQPLFLYIHPARWNWHMIIASYVRDPQIHCTLLLPSISVDLPSLRGWTNPSYSMENVRVWGPGFANSSDNISLGFLLHVLLYDPIPVCLAGGREAQDRLILEVALLCPTLSPVLHVVICLAGAFHLPPKQSLRSQYLGALQAGRVWGTRVFVGWFSRKKQNIYCPLRHITPSVLTPYFPSLFLHSNSAQGCHGPQRPVLVLQGYHWQQSPRLLLSFAHSLWISAADPSILLSLLFSLPVDNFSVHGPESFSCSGSASWASFRVVVCSHCVASHLLCAGRGFCPLSPVQIFWEREIWPI